MHRYAARKIEAQAVPFADESVFKRILGKEKRPAHHSLPAPYPPAARAFAPCLGGKRGLKDLNIGGILCLRPPGNIAFTACKCSLYPLSILGKYRAAIHYKAIYTEEPCLL